MLAIANVTYQRLASLEEERTRRCFATRIGQRRELLFEQDEAALAAAKAAVELSRLNLEWCRVLSPIDGRVSNKIVTVGNLVNGGAWSNDAADDRAIGIADLLLCRRR